MSLKSPPAVNYSDPWVMMPAVLNRKAPEGEKQAAFEVAWATQGGVNNSVSFNMQNQTTATFSQICALAVDNSDCGMDVRFLFPDTGYTVTIPAAAPSLIIPVFTNQVQFFLIGTVNNEVEEPKDITRFTVLNFCPPPIAVPPTTAQELGALSFTTVDGTASTPLIPASSVYSSGSVQGIQARFSGLTTGAGVAIFKIVDGAGQQIAWFQMAAATATVYNVELYNLNPCDIRYSGGLFLQQSGAVIGGQVAISIPVKLP